jgi:hypothetical protein
VGRASLNDSEKRGLLYLFFIPLQSSFKRGDKMTEFPGAHRRWKEEENKCEEHGKRKVQNIKEKHLEL